jgi:hypothetical protein
MGPRSWGPPTDSTAHQYDKDLDIHPQASLFAQRSCIHAVTRAAQIGKLRTVCYNWMELRPQDKRDPVSAPPYLLPLTILALAQTLQGRVAMPDVLPTEPSLAGARAVARTGITIPGTVWVPGQAAFGTGTAISLTLVQLQLGHTQLRAHVQHLLGRNTGRGWGEPELHQGAARLSTL